MGRPPSGRSAWRWGLGWLAAAALVIAACAISFHPVVPGYFLADDFGVVQLLASKPPWHTLTLFTTPWTESAFGSPLDELRPTVALAFQMGAWLGDTPASYHGVVLAVHTLNALLVLAIARTVARLGWPAALFAAVLFAALPVQAETAAWLQGLSDSVPTASYLATFLAYARWRQTARGGWYVAACALCLLALFSKQSLITVLATLLSYDVLRAGRLPPLRWAAWRPYLPFLLLTVGYLVLRYALFGQAVREDRLTLQTLAYFAEVQAVAVQQLLLGGVPPPGSAAQWLLGAGLLAAAGVGAVLAWRARHMARPAGCHGAASLGWALLFFGPVWWLIATLPLVMTYHAPRHLCLASAGVAVALGAALQWSAAQGGRPARLAATTAGLALITLAAILLHRPLGEWSHATRQSEQILRELEREALAAPAGSLLVVSAPAVATPAGGWQDRVWVWAWALPFAARPPFLADDLTARVHLLYISQLDCCADADARAAWAVLMRERLATWAAADAALPVVLLYWPADGGTLQRRTEAEQPDLRARVLALAASPSAEALDAAINALAPQVLR